MNQIPGTELFEFDTELIEIKAKRLTQKYDLPYDRVFKILDQTVLKEPIHAFEYEPDEVTTDELVYCLRFEPCLEKALTVLRADVAIKIFETEYPEKMNQLLESVFPAFFRVTSSNETFAEIATQFNPKMNCQKWGISGNTSDFNSLF